MKSISLLGILVILVVAAGITFVKAHLVPLAVLYLGVINITCYLKTTYVKYWFKFEQLAKRCFVNAIRLEWI